MSAQPFDAVQGGGLEGGQGGGDDRHRVAGDSIRLPQLLQRRVIAVTLLYYKRKVYIPIKENKDLPGVKSSKETNL